MDVHFLYGDQQFVWDASKAAENRSKHGISFERACEVFFDELCAYIDASVPHERRSAVIGLTEDLSVLFVVHIARENETIRIISARPAIERERRQYEDG
jgi:hypothetical protein